MKNVKAIALAFGIGLCATSWASNYHDVKRPIDNFDYTDKVQGVSTLRDDLQAQGNFPLAKALFTIGRLDLVGLAPGLDSFETNTVETPLGGDFAVSEEQELQYRSARFTRTSVFDKPSRFAERRAAQRSQVRTYRLP
jgi:hypothetical protein